MLLSRSSELGTLFLSNLTPAKNASMGLCSISSFNFSLTKLSVKLMDIFFIYFFAFK